MDTSFIGAYRPFTVETIFSDAVRAPERKIIWRTRPKVTNGIPDPTNEELIQITGGAMNIVSSRDVRRNVRRSIEIGMDLAREGKRVLYLNSYAGIALMRESLKTAMEKQSELGKDTIGDPQPSLLFEEAEEADEEEEAEEDSPEDTQDDYFNEDEVRFPESSIPFQILDCKMGLWEHYDHVLEGALFDEKCVSYASSETILTQKIDILILNAFEFVAIDYRPRMALVTRLLEWLDKLDLTIIVFTQEVKAVMEAGVLVRGPLGLLTAHAASLAKLDAVRKGRNGVNGRNGSVHEQVPNTAIKIFYSFAGNIVGVEYPRGYCGKEYVLNDFPLSVDDPLPEGMDAVRIVGSVPGYNRRAA